MGLSLLAYSLLGITGVWMWLTHRSHEPRPVWLRSLHLGIGSSLVLLVLLLLAVGIVGTLGHYGWLGHSAHLPSGIAVVSMVLVSAISGSQIRPQRPWVRVVHLSTNLGLLIGLIAVSATGWNVVQKYLP
jgi:hypothetical protein